MPGRGMVNSQAMNFVMAPVCSARLVTWREISESRNAAVTSEIVCAGRSLRVTNPTASPVQLEPTLDG